MGQGAYLSTALAIRIVVREVGQVVVVVVVAAVVAVVGTRVVVLGRVARAAVFVVAPPAALRLASFTFQLCWEVQSKFPPPAKQPEGTAGAATPPRRRQQS